MRKYTVMSVGVVVLLAATSAQAGFVSINLDSDDGELIGVATNIGADGNAEVGFTEVWREGQDSYSVHVSGETDADPVMTITKVVENTTGLPWIDYQIDLVDPAGATFVGTPVSSDFSFDAGASTATSLVFAPGNLADGEAVTFAFDINVPTTGDFGFTIAQSATVIPEPATLLMALLMAGAGAAATLRYRWG